MKMPAWAACDAGVGVSRLFPDLTATANVSQGFTRKKPPATVGRPHAASSVAMHPRRARDLKRASRRVLQNCIIIAIPLLFL